MSAAGMWVKLCGNCGNGGEKREAKNGGKRFVEVKITMKTSC